MRTARLELGNVPRAVWRAAMGGVAVLWLTACGIGFDGAVDQGDGGAGDGGAGCQYSFTVSPAEPMVDVPVQLEAYWTDDCYPDPESGFAWSVMSPSNDSVTPTVTHGGQAATFVPAFSGTYSVKLAVQDLLLGRLSVQRGVTVVLPGAQQTTYRLLLSPPAEVDVPRQIRTQVVHGGTPVDGLVYSLEQGTTVSAEVLSDGRPAPGYVRFTLSGPGLVQEVRTDPDGWLAVSLLGDRSYDVLVVPDGDAVAPIRLPGMTAADLLAPGALEITPGLAVLGHVQGDSGAPVAGARVVLRSEGVPSSVGTSDGIDGRFLVRARAGAQALEVEPPWESGLPRIDVPQGAGIELGASESLSLLVRYAGGPPPVQATVHVTDAPAGAPVAGARVTLEATQLGELAQVSVSQDGSVVAQIAGAGSCKRWGTTNSEGTVVFDDLPAGRYRAVVEPPGDGATAGITTVVSTLDITGLSPTVALALSPPALLEGTVVDELGDPVSDVHVVAVTSVGVGSAEEGWTDEAGYFALDVIQGATYQVILSAPTSEPPRARLVFAQVRVESQETELQGTGPLGALVLQPGLALAGEVLYQGNPLAGVLIQAIDPQGAGTLVIAEAVSDLNGRFRIVVPDPNMGQ